MQENVPEFLSTADFYDLSTKKKSVTNFFFHFTYGDNFYTCMSFFFKSFVNIPFFGRREKDGATGRVGGRSCCNPSTGHTMC
jgi:hypothetical protein